MPTDIEIMQEANANMKLAHEAFKKELEHAKEVKTWKDEVVTPKLEALNTVLDKEAKRIDEIIMKMSALPVASVSEAEKKAKTGELLRKAFKDRNSFGVGWNPSEEIKALALQPDSSGGHLAPVEYVNEIIKGVVEFSPVRQYARVFNTSTPGLKIPKRIQRPGVTKHSEATSESENTNVNWGLKDIRTKNYISIQIASNESLADAAFNIEQQLSMDTSFEFGVSEGTDFISGNGVTAPEGILTNANVTLTQTTTNDAFVAADVIELFYALKEAYAMRGVFMSNRAIIKKIRQFVSDTGEFLWQPGLNGEASQTLLGKPIREATDLTGTVADAAKIMLFGDFGRGYGIVDRQGIIILRDPYSNSSAVQTKFVFTKRTGGAVLDEAAIKILQVA